MAGPGAVRLVLNFSVDNFSVVLLLPFVDVDPLLPETENPECRAHGAQTCDHVSVTRGSDEGKYGTRSVSATRSMPSPVVFSWTVPTTT